MTFSLPIILSFFTIDLFSYDFRIHIDAIVYYTNDIYDIICAIYKKWNYNEKLH
jgi:hypothetical protein